MLEHGYNSCPLCQEPYDLISVPNKPPFGTMTYSVYDAGSVKWHSMNFNLHHELYRRTQRAYYPICEEGDLALWLICEAWKAGKLFSMGTSVTTGAYGIVFSGIHLRTSTSYGVTNHGYSSNPKNDMKQILKNLINECNAFNIFIPSQLDDFAGIEPDDSGSRMTQLKAATLIKNLMLQRQTNLRDLREQHKHRLDRLSEWDYFYVRQYPTAFLMGMINWGTELQRIQTELKNKKQTRIHLNKTTVNNKINAYSYGSNKMKPNFVPNYIVNLSKVIREFPRTTKPFYVYRGARINEKSPTSPHQSINPMPFSTSLHAWMALNFARLKIKIVVCIESK